MEGESRYEKELGGALLASVSRSFYLTLKALPAVLREPISLAYLLARTADTIADTPQVPGDLRLAVLDDFSSLVQGSSKDVADLSSRLAAEFRPLQNDAAEATLMARTQEALAWLETMEGARLEAIRKVLAPIIHGQKLDIQRFPSASPLHSIETAAELEDYTWLVAGCVGEFWTRLCFSEMPDAFAPGADRETTIQTGIRYGKGLQLVNILRDIFKDARLGRCYLPAAEWRPLGLSEKDIAANPAVLLPVWKNWLASADEHLRHGIDYVCAISHSRLRHATALPVLFGVRTLAILESASEQQLREGAKIGRLEIGSLLVQATMSNSQEGIRNLARKLRGKSKQ